jgi:hypothetical protein
MPALQTQDVLPKQIKRLPSGHEMTEVDSNLLEKVSRDRAIASAILFAHRHPQESAPAHIEMIELWRSRDEFVIIEAAREFAKTTVSEEFLLLEGCFGNFFYCLLIGETYAKACQRLEAIDYEATNNIKLHSLFGGKVMLRKSNENKMWFKAGPVIEAVGWEQELQSFKHQAFRPDRAYLDDIENRERVRDSASVDESMRKLYLELIPAMDKRLRKIRITQTRRAEDCMVTRLARDPEWLYRAFPICNGDPDDPSTQSNWPARYPMDWIRNEKTKYQSQGMLAEFMQAYMLQTTDQKSKPFQESHIKSVDVSPWHWMPKFAVYDPARTAHTVRSKGVDISDRYARVVASRMGSKILVHESGADHCMPSQFVEDIFRCHNEHGLAKIGIEKNSLDDWLMEPVRLAMLKKGVMLPVKALQAPQDRSKDDFIMGLMPFFEAGDILLV